MIIDVLSDAGVDLEVAPGVRLDKNGKPITVTDFTAEEVGHLVTFKAAAAAFANAVYQGVAIRPPPPPLLRSSILSPHWAPLPVRPAPIAIVTRAPLPVLPPSQIIGAAGADVRQIRDQTQAVVLIAPKIVPLPSRAFTPMLDTPANVVTGWGAAASPPVPIVRAPQSQAITPSSAPPPVVTGGSQFAVTSLAPIVVPPPKSVADASASLAPIPVDAPHIVASPMAPVVIPPRSQADQSAALSPAPQGATGPIVSPRAPVVVPPRSSADATAAIFPLVVTQDGPRIVISPPPIVTPSPRSAADATAAITPPPVVSSDAPRLAASPILRVVSQPPSLADSSAATSTPVPYAHPQLARTPPPATNAVPASQALTPPDILPVVSWSLLAASPLRVQPVIAPSRISQTEAFAPAPQPPLPEIVSSPLPALPSIPRSQALSPPAGVTVVATFFLPGVVGRIMPPLPQRNTSATLTPGSWALIVVAPVGGGGHGVFSDTDELETTLIITLDRNLPSLFQWKTGKGPRR